MLTVYLKPLHNANMMDKSEAMCFLTYAISCIVGQGVRVYYILAAKYLHQLVKELAFLFLSSGNKKQNFRACYKEAECFKVHNSSCLKPYLPIPSPNDSTYFLPSKKCRKLALSLFILV